MSKSETKMANWEIRTSEEQTKAPLHYLECEYVYSHSTLYTLYSYISGFSTVFTT